MNGLSDKRGDRNAEKEKYGKIANEVINIFVKNDMSVGECSDFMLFLRHKIEEQKILPQKNTEE